MELFRDSDADMRQVNSMTKYALAGTEILEHGDCRSLLSKKLTMKIFISTELIKRKYSVQIYDLYIY